MLNFPFRQTFNFTLKCNIAVQNIGKKALVCVCVSVCVCVAKPFAVELRCHATALIFVSIN